jgi:hypothetical protein
MPPSRSSPSSAWSWNARGRSRAAGQQTNPDRRAVLTCKEPAADAVTGSKPRARDQGCRRRGGRRDPARVRAGAPGRHPRGVQVAVPRRGDDAEVASCIFSNRAGFIQTG